MKKAIVGKKIGMTQVFTDDGRLVPVTVVEAGPCKVVQKKTTESDGYEAVQVGFDTYAENRAQKLVNKPMAGHFKKADVAPTRYLREFRLDNVAELEVGNELTVSQFEAGEKIDVSGISKGHGFTGTIQRWNQHTGPMAHGSKYHRGVGSMDVFGTLVLPLEWRRVCRELLELQKGCEGPFGSSDSKYPFVTRLPRNVCGALKTSS